MEEQEKNNQSDNIEVAPVESPSENFLVTEHLQRMPGIFSRGLIYLIVMILIAALVYSLVCRIDIVVESNSVARPASHIIKILSGRDGYIEEIFVSDGEKVEENAPLLRIRSKEALTYRARVVELRSSIPLKKEYYDTKMSSVDEELRQLERELRSTLLAKNLKLEQNNISLDTVSYDLTYWQNEARIQSGELEDMKKLFEEGLVVMKDYREVESKQERARTEVVKQNAKRDIGQKEKLIIEGAIADAKADYQNRKYIFEKTRKELELEKTTTIQSMENELGMNEGMMSIMDDTSLESDLEKEPGSLVRTEKAGTIGELYFRNAGDYVTESDLLCTVVPAGSPLYMDITVANRDIGFIEKAMKIKYKFNAFPYNDYGMLYGNVSAVSSSAVEGKAHEFLYQVKGTLDRDFFEIRGKKYKIKAGMTATAELVTERKTIFTSLFQTVKEKIKP